MEGFTIGFIDGFTSRDSRALGEDRSGTVAALAVVLARVRANPFQSVIPLLRPAEGQGQLRGASWGFGIRGWDKIASLVVMGAARAQAMLMMTCEKRSIGGGNTKSSRIET